MPSKRLASLDQPSGRLMRPVQIVETDPFPRVDDRSTCLRKGIAHSSPQNRKPGLGQFRSMMSLFGEDTYFL